MAKIARFEMPDGRVARFEVPDDATPDQAQAMMSAHFGADAQSAPQAPQGGSRAPAFAMRGLAESATDLLTAPAEAVAWAGRQAGLDMPGGYAAQIKSGWKNPDEQPQTTAEKLAHGLGRGVGDAASVMVPGGAIRNASRLGTVLRGIGEALSTSPVTQLAAGAAGGGVGEATGSPALGTAAALATGMSPLVAGRAISPITNRLTPEQTRLAGVAAQEGIPLRAGAQTGSRNLQYMESVLDRIPGSGGMGDAANQATREGFNAAVLKRAGIDGKYASPEAMQTAAKQISKEFDDISARTSLTLDAPLLTDLQNVLTRYGRKMPSQQRETVQNYVDDIMNTGNVMPGDVYQITRSDLGTAAKSAANSDATYSGALKGIQQALDAAMERSIPAADRGDWADLRQRYASFKAITKAMGTAGAEAAGGNIPASALWGAVKGQNPNSFPRGAGELNDLARVGQLFVKPQTSDSGTAQRNMLINLLTGGAALGGGAAGVSGGSILTGAAVGAGSLAVPAAVQAAMLSRPGTRYLTNQAGAGLRGASDPRVLAALLAARAKAHTGGTN